jgi:hypothetical protein
MVSIGVLAFVLAFAASDEPAEVEPAASSDDGDPRVVAENFLDAWRKREHDRALALATGAAAAEVRERREADARLSEEDRSVKEQLWDPMASERLTLEVDREGLIDGGLALFGRAVGRFVGQPYEREVTFELVEEDSGYRVRSMELGRILSATPEILDVEGKAP